MLQTSDFGFVAEPSVEIDRVGPLSLEEIERRHIGNVLRHTDGNVSQTARIPRDRSRDADTTRCGSTASSGRITRRHERTPHESNS